jgi:hypothetical protein
MDQLAERVDRLISRTNILLSDHLLSKVSVALTVCRLAEHHSGTEKREQVTFASRVYEEVDEFSHRRGAVLNQELMSSMHRLHLELEKLDVGA